MPDASDIKNCQPWEYVWRVAYSKSIGQGCKKAVYWDERVRYLIQNQMFFM